MQTPTLFMFLPLLILQAVNLLTNTALYLHFITPSARLTHADPEDLLCRGD
ncbi:hypothetical protein KsCSTR_20890 [Candidatus Kuenenia stuttgartiensis]|jgi:hypothetical protein|uniref:Uncharacterized protein n=1 Tax=Kuenenia stuttgartiensis TaxID=174633 RepID=Q1Q2X8_KUEST|nr:hypothetical protein KsCSTR_20890 [Candidatus Kuenenia stuttgartiensis]CAJ74364.1 unknown protein [Candidatus Kuenenia stuttgartiensis]